MLMHTYVFIEAFGFYNKVKIYDQAKIFRKFLSKYFELSGGLYITETRRDWIRIG